jgi:elongation factor P hydroxylase
MRDLDIAYCFNSCFAHACNTQLLGGALEPLYLPAQASQSARLYYREDFAASALHEAAHWCIAGKRRRGLVDFGYAYEPPPRSETSQQNFYRLELKVQTLECFFAQAAGVVFRPSADNLSADVRHFAEAIERARGDVYKWMQHTRDSRAARFYDALMAVRHG